MDIKEEKKVRCLESSCLIAADLLFAFKSQSAVFGNSTSSLKASVIDFFMRKKIVLNVASLRPLILLTLAQEELEAMRKADAQRVEQQERAAGFVSSRTATVRGAIASLGNMAIAEDMNFTTMFHEIDVCSVLHHHLTAFIGRRIKFTTLRRCCRGLAD